MPGIVDAFDLYMSKRDRNNKDEQFGEVVSVSATTAQVRIRGTGQHQEAALGQGIHVESGDYCVLSPNRMSPRPRWIISSILGNRDTGPATTRRPYTEIFPPQNFTSLDSIPGTVVFEWDTPITILISFEVQTSPDQSEVTGELTTGGSYAIIGTDVPLYGRIRSIAPDGQVSAWTDWLLASPGESALTSTGIPITNCGLPIWVDGYMLVYEEDA